jgi:hypothetical protein
MNLASGTLDRLRNPPAISGKAQTARPNVTVSGPLISSYYTAHQAITPQWPYYALVNAYKSWCYTCIDKVSKAVAMVPKKLYIYRRAGKKMVDLTWLSSYKFKAAGKPRSPAEKKYFLKEMNLERVEVTEHPFLELMKRPNAMMTQFSIWYETMVRLELGGLCGWLKLRDKLGVTRQLWPLPLTQFALLKPKVSPTMELQYWDYQDGNIKQRFDPKDICLFKYPHPASPFEGMSPLMAQTYPYDIDLFLSQQQRALFKNGAFPGIILNTDQVWGPEQVNEFKEQFSEQYEGVNRAGGVLVGHSGLKFEGMAGTTARDAMIDRVAKFAREKLITAFDLSESKIGLQENQNRACYSADTETLTENGWKLYSEIGPDEKIATFNPENNYLEYHKPISKHVYPYAGKMIHFKTRTCDSLVTPDHDIWARTLMHTGGFRKIHASKLAERNAKMKFQACVNYGGRERAKAIIPNDIEIKMDTWLEFMGYYLSEGGLSHSTKPYLLTLSQKDQIKAEKIEACLKALPFHWKRYPIQKDGMTRWNVYGKSLCQYLMDNVGGYCFDKRIPRELMNLSQRQLRILFDALMLGDGSWDMRKNRNSGSYYTTSKKLANDVQELSFKLGYCVGLIISRDNRPNRRKVYRLVISNRKEHTLTPKRLTRTPSSIYEIDYEGPVYCFNVPHHLFITRRNGKIGIHGNTAEVMDVTFVRECIQPKTMLIEEVLETFFLTDYDEGLSLDMELPDFDDREFRMKERDSNLRNFYSSINQERAKDGEEPVEWGEKPWIPFSVMQMGEKPEPALPAPEATGKSIESKRLTRDFWTERKKDLYWKMFMRTLDSYQGMIERPMKHYFKALRTEVINRLHRNANKVYGQFSGWSRAKVEKALKESKAIRDINITRGVEEKKLESLITPVVKSIIADVGRRRIKDLLESYKLAATFDESAERITKWLGNRMRMFSKAVAGTTFDEIEKILKEGFANEDPVTTIASTISDKFESWDKYRAPLLARTETCASFSFADLESVKQSGLEDTLLKAWLSARDDHCRPTHQAADLKYNANPIGIDEDFEVGADHMLCPGNGELAEENVQCRCTQIFVEKEGE